MAVLRRALGSGSVWLLALCGLAGQTGGGHTVERPGQGSGNPIYPGPTDVADPGKASSGEEGSAPLPPVVIPIPVEVPAPPSVSGAVPGGAYWSPPDMTEWRFWWRLQRAEVFSADGGVAEPEGPVTPGRAVAAAAPAPVLVAPAAGVAVPALMELWRGAPQDADLRAEILVALGRCGHGPEVEDAIRSGLRDRDERVVEAAVLGLGALRTPHAASLLADLVADSAAGRGSIGEHEVPPRVRAAAALAAGMILERLPHRPLREVAHDGLRAGLRAKASASDEVPAACALAMGLCPGEDAASLLSDLLAVLQDSRRPERVRAHALVAAAKLAARDPVPARVASLMGEFRRRMQPQENAFVRQACALAFGRLGTVPQAAEVAAGALESALEEDGDPGVRHLAAIGMAEVAASPHPAGQGRALPALLRALHSGTDADRAWVALAIGWSAALARDRGVPLPPSVGRELMTAWPQASDTQFRSALAVALGLAEHWPSAATVEEGLHRVGDPLLRAESAAGLALLRGAASVLERELQRADPLTEAYGALCAAMALRAPAQLTASLGTPLDSPSPTYQARFAAATGLGWLPDPGAARRLAALADARQPALVRVLAVRSLGRAAERPGPRWSDGYLDLLQPFAAPAVLLAPPRPTGPDRPGILDRG